MALNTTFPTELLVIHFFFLTASCASRNQIATQNHGRFPSCPPPTHPRRFPTVTQDERVIHKVGFKANLGNQEGYQGPELGPSNGSLSCIDQPGADHPVPFIYVDNRNPFTTPGPAQHCWLLSMETSRGAERRTCRHFFFLSNFCTSSGDNRHRTILVTALE